jgi:hypothetical protein
VHVHVFMFIQEQEQKREQQSLSPKQVLGRLNIRDEIHNNYFN